MNPPSRPQRILVRGVNWLGDAVMTTPALLRLREAQPQARILLLTHSKLAGLWTHHPAVDEVIPFQPEESPWTLGRRLHSLGCDTALVLPNSPRSALEVFLARIPRRIGHARRWRSFLLTDPIPPRADEQPMRKRSPDEVRRLIAGTASSHPAGGSVPSPAPRAAHHIHQYLHLAAALGASREPLAPCVAVTGEERAELRHRLNLPAAPAGVPVLGLNAGAEYGPAKRWPAESFLAAAILLQRRLGCHWWIFGGPSDVILAEGITAGIRAAQSGPPGPAAAVTCLAGRTSLRELCVALNLCDLVLTNDTGPMHLAAAVGTPVVVPFGSTSPVLTGPGLPGDPRHRFLHSTAPCSPCFQRDCPIDLRCLRGISIEEVARAVERALPAHPSARS